MKKRKSTHRHKYTEEQKQFIRDHVAGRSYQEITELFNAKFGTAFEVGRVGGAIKRLGLVNGRNSRFHTEQTPWNLGRKGIHLSPGTEFKKGCTPVNHKPVGSERVNKDGYLEVKISEPNKWVHKHRHLWEIINGQVPAGHAIIFADGDRRNLDLYNLLLVTRGELAVMNKLGLPVGGSKEITETSLQIARLKMAIAGRKRKPPKEQP